MNTSISAFSREIESEFEALLRMLDFSSGLFSISVAVCNDLETEQQLVYRALHLRPGIQELLVPPLATNLLQMVTNSLTHSAPTALFIRDLKASVSSSELDQHTFQSLNADRDRWRELIGCPVVIWIPEYAAAKLAKNAHDFSRMISHRFHFVRSVERSITSTENRLNDHISTFDLATDERSTRLSELISRLKSTETVETLREQRLRWLLEASEHAIQLGDRAAAGQFANDALQLAEQNLEQFGASLQGLRDVSVSLITLGDVELAEGDRAAALERYHRSLQLAEKILEQFGASPESLRDVSVSLDRVGDVELAEGDRVIALERYRRSLQLREQIVEQFGVSPQSLRDVSVSLDRVGDVELAEGDRVAALDRYRRSLQLREQIVEQFGASPQSLRDVSVSQNKVGEVEQAEGDRAAAYRRSLLLAEQIVEQFGASLESLRDMSISLERVGDVERAEGDRAAALERYVRSLQLREQIVEQFGVSPQSLRDVSVSLDRVGDVELAEGDRAAALERYRRSLRLREQIVEQFGASPQSLEDWALSLYRVERIPEAIAKLEEIISRGWGSPRTQIQLNALRGM